MRYILDSNYYLRGWDKLPYAIWNKRKNKAMFMDRERFKFFLKLSGKVDIDIDSLDEKTKDFLQNLVKSGIAREAKENETRDLNYCFYPSSFKKSVQWSITGLCNYHCKHCFISSPNGKLGSPTKEQCLDIVRQLAECGIHEVSLTGGEPLVRSDFFEIVDELVLNEIKVSTIYSNGKLVTDAFLDECEKHNIHPSFQISFDGVGWHDWMRGVKGAEQIAIDAVKRLHDRGYLVGCAMCLCKENIKTIRETVKVLADAGCTSMKLQCTSPEGEWANQKEHFLTNEETFQYYLDYLPQFKEDGSPMSLQMEGLFIYNKHTDDYAVPTDKRIPEEYLDVATPCMVVKNNLYIGANGAVLPCMGVAGTGIEKDFPNIYETPLSKILTNSSYTDKINKSVKYLLDSNPECKDCPHKCKCCGGCRAFALAENTNDYFYKDPVACLIHKNGWVNRVHDVADKLWKRMADYSDYSEKSNSDTQSNDCEMI